MTNTTTTRFDRCIRRYGWGASLWLMLVFSGCLVMPDPPNSHDDDDDTDDDDWDGDGYTEADGDCNDEDDSIHPGADEICNAIDDNCVDGIDEGFDADGDGVTTCGPDGIADTEDDDCDDTNPDVYPDASEICNAIDDNCVDGIDEGFDADGDGVTTCGPDGIADTEDDDCDDANDTVYPGAPEICDNQDNDCDGSYDEGLPSVIYCVDEDGDGYGDPLVPTQYCSPPSGYVEDCTDCNDADASINPDAPEVACDGLDNDCDEVQHPEDVDDDGDGWTECDGDCDDTRPEVYPGATEICNNIDDDCDGVIDDDPAPVDWYPDADGDGHGDPAGPVINACEPQPGHVQWDDDCDDTNATVYSGAPELCDGLDNDCDGILSGDEIDDDGDGVTECDGDCDDTNAAVYPGAFDGCDGLDNDCDGVIPASETDDDGDGYEECGIGGADQDCDDADASIHPGATETCNGVDDDCDGTVDNDVVTQDWYPDADHDGYGDPDATPVNDCIPPTGYVADATDCDDAAFLVNPGMAELPCDGVDNNCDGLHHENDADGDLDGYTECDGDCDDANPDTYPGAMEICDGEDNDCLGGVPANERDDDGDGFEECGIGGAPQDCDDTQPTVYPGAPEICDSLDNDCDGSLGVDEVDADGDGYTVCGGDCDDADAVVHPGADEGCDGIDTDCDGSPGPDEVDADADGYMVCDGDCDDANPDTYPGATEICDGEDNDCDSAVPADETDDDSDGYEECGIGGADPDCDDADADVNPGEPETHCDGIDNDCDAASLDDPDDDGDGWTLCAPDADCDDTDPALNWDDADSDGAATCDTTPDCDDSDPSLNQDDADSDTWSTCDGDCDDWDDTVYPGAQEICSDGIDQDCDGEPDDGCSAGCEALELDGQDDAILVDGSPTFDGLAVMTVEIWFQPTVTLEYNAAGEDKVLFYQEQTANTCVWGMGYDQDDGELFFGVQTDSGGSNDPRYVVTLTAGIWHHVAGTWDGTTAELYLDGIHVASDGNNPGTMLTTSPDPLNIGRKPYIWSEDPGGNFFPGLLGEVRISDVVRYTPAGAPYQPNVEFTDDNDTLLLLNLDEGTGTPVDNSIYGHTISFESTPAWVESCISTMCEIQDLEPSLATWTITGSIYRLINEASVETGDLDDDGEPDLVLSSKHSVAQSYTGQVLVYLSSDRASWLSSTMLDTDASVTVAAGSVSFARDVDVGDITGDGIDDLIVVQENTPYTAYFFYGPLSPGSLTPANADKTVSFSRVLAGVLAGHDFDGDGDDDLVIASRDHPNPGSGYVWAFRGRSEADWATVTDQSSADLTISLTGVDFEIDNLSAGFLDEDLYPDLVIGGWYLSGDGYIHIAFGGSGNDFFSGSVLWSDLDVSLINESSGDRVDVAMVPGDLDGDGFDDLVTSANQLDATPYTNSGRVYLFYGRPRADWTILSNLAEADATIDGTADDFEAGQNLGAPGDLNGDGLAEFAVGSYLNAAQDGEVTLWYGHPQRMSGSYTSTDADGVGTGTAGLYYAWLQDGIIDLDGDGQGEIVVGAANGGPTGVETRIYGFDPALLCLDLDGDGFKGVEGDCDDGDASVHPNATETCDGVDDNCDGVMAPDCWMDVSAGGGDTCGIREGGSIECWGAVGALQLSTLLGPFESVSVGGQHACAVSTVGTVHCWGDNSSQQCDSPAGAYEQVSAGEWHSCGLHENGDVECWGDNSNALQSEPAGPFVEADGRGDWHICAILDDDTVECWGRELVGETVEPGETFLHVSGGNVHSCGIQSNQTLECWGCGVLYDYGQCTPPQGTYEQISSGQEHSCAIDTTGAVQCWGCGNEDDGQCTAPGGSFTRVSAGMFHSCGIESSGSLQCWGCNNNYGGDFGQCIVP